MGDQLLQAALAYADRFGWWVFPIKPGRKEPLTQHGCLDATSDAETICEWWTRWPAANVGIACGQSGLVVIDIDPAKGGEESWSDLCQRHSIDDNTVISLTGAGGQHFVFTNPNGADIRNSVGHLGPGVDVRGNGGYIVAPPSIHPNGREYAWEVTAHPADRKPAPLPVPLLKLLTDGDQVTPKVAPLLPDRIPEGRRNEVLTSLAGSMRRWGTGKAAILAALAVENERCEPPLDQAELERIAKSMMRYEPVGRRQETKPIGSRLPKDQARAVIEMAPIEPPDPALRQAILEALLATGMKEKPPALLRRQMAGRLLLDWLHDNGGLVQSETGTLHYFSRVNQQLFSLDSDRWAAYLYTLTGANPAGTDYAYLAADCKAAAIATPRRHIVRVAAWDDDAQVLRVSRFDGIVYVLDGENIGEEPNGASVIFEDDPLWLPYKPDFSTSRGLHWSTTDLPNWENNDEAHGLAFRAWVISTFFCELCPTRPLLVFVGEKGSGKSMALRVLLQLLFGPIAQLSGVPDKPDGFTAAAAAAHILAIDNLDQFTPWLRDKLSRISTGAEDYYRKLYTSSERGHVVYRCWLAFTARSPDTLRRDDLADRLLILPVQRISDNVRRPERDFLAQTIVLRNAWWGSLLTTLNQTVAMIKSGKLVSTSRLRMADWESLGRLIARGEGKEGVWEAFIDDLERAQSAFLLEGDLLIDALEIWLRIETNQGRDVSTRELYEEWTALLFGGKRPPKDWPGSIGGLGKRLANIRRDLATIYRVVWLQDRTRRVWYRFWPKV